jgi:hypothetical protein
MEYAVAIWLFSLFAIVGYKLLTGHINLHGLLSHRDGGFSPERAQLLIATLASVVAYAQQAIAAGEMSEPSTLVLSGIAGSQTLYVAGKYARHLVFSAKTIKRGNKNG